MRRLALRSAPTRLPLLTLSLTTHCLPITPSCLLARREVWRWRSVTCAMVVLMINVLLPLFVRLLKDRVDGRGEVRLNEWIDCLTNLPAESTSSVERPDGVLTLRIDITQWVPLNIRVRVDAGFQPDRVTLNVAPRRGLIVAINVVEGLRLLVIDLARHPLVVLV